MVFDGKEQRAFGVVEGGAPGGTKRSEQPRLYVQHDDERVVPIV